MFLVITRSPIDVDWEERDRLILEAVGFRSDYSVASYSSKGGQREHLWKILEFKKAVAIKDKLNKIPLVDAFVREK